MAPRWKRKGAEAKALAEPVSYSVSELQLSLAETETSGSLSSCNVLLAVEPDEQSQPEKVSEKRSKKHYGCYC
ncbi:hypothetical protein HA466_0006240 [Hirschfeldia incana]|nr:hypothetical protein HA466_0006240 [Hirschfeldia incana]KAJ0266665.1 hypothetical protein HA466_0006240 [Hirschfeldia incana]